MTAVAIRYRIVKTPVVFFRSVWKISMQFAVMDSNTEIQDVSAANAARTKNSKPMILPAAPIQSNTFGRDMNISPGPADMPSTPKKTNTAGMIIAPARRATPVSMISIKEMDFPRFTSRFT